MQRAEGTSNVMSRLAIYIGAALAEIAGCFAFWAWLRLDRSPLWLWVAESQLPDRWDVTGATLCLVGAAIILGAHDPFEELNPY